MLPTFRRATRLAILVSLSAFAGDRAAGQAYTWHTHVGSSGGPGFNDGFGAAAHFSGPSGVAVGSSGTIYVTDTNNHTIRKIAPDGLVSTFVGRPGSPFTANGGPAEARFNTPSGIAIDASGNLFVSELAAHTIRKITPGGVVSTFAGSPGIAGSGNGTGGAARFNGPRGLAFDPEGNLLVADSNNHVIRKISPGGEVSTFAGLAGTLGSADGNKTDARFRTPRGLTVAGDGTVYVADTANQLVRRISTDGTVSTLAGTAGQLGTVDGAGSEARLYLPAAICIDSDGNLRVAEYGSSLLRKVTAAGFVTTIGSGQLTMSRPTGVAMASNGDVIVAESGADTISRVSPGAVLSPVAGSAGTVGSIDGKGTSARFCNPKGVAARPDGSLVIADTLNSIIRGVAPDGTVTTLAGTSQISGTADGLGSAAQFYIPEAVAFANNDIVLVADTGNLMIRSISASGQVSTLAGRPGSRPNIDTILYVRSLVPAPDGSIIFADGRNLRGLSTSGVPTLIAGKQRSVAPAIGYPFVAVWNTNIAGSTPDGVGTGAYLGSAAGLCLDPEGTTYFADSSYHTIRKCSANGSVTTLYGKTSNSGYVDGSASAARFKEPRGMARDAAGNLYVVDTGNHAIRRISSSGTVTTIGGLPGYAGSGDGTGSSAQFDTPSGITIDADGFLYVADTNNHRIARGVPPDHPEIEVENSGGSLLVSGGSSLAFGEITAGETATHVITIRNPGTASLNLSNIRLTGSPGFAVDLASFPALIPPQESRTLAVRFAPGSAGVRTASLFLDSNDENEASFSVALSGTGLNRSPVFSAYSFTTPKEQAAVISVAKVLSRASDPDGDTLLLSSTGPLPETQGSVSLQDNRLSYTPAVGFSGEDKFQVTITDSNGLSVNGIITVNVTAPDTPGTPTTNPPQVTVMTRGKIAVKFNGIPGRTYAIERSADMELWLPLSNVTAGPTGAIEFLDENPLSPQGFYRLISP